MILNEKIQIRKVTGGPLGVNTYVVSVADSDSCILIDPGADIEGIQNAIHGMQVKAVLLTHAHYDHILNLGFFYNSGTRLYIHEKDADMLADPDANFSSVFADPVGFSNADRLVHDGDTIEEAGFSVRVLHTPGHTRGSVCYLTGEALFSGDTMFRGTCGRTDLPGGSEMDMLHSLIRLCQLDPNIHVYPGHGPGTVIAIEKSYWT